MVNDKDFPNLKSSGYHETSPINPAYNCIAWALGKDQEWVEPDSLNQYAWPKSVPRNYTIDSFVQLFESEGYQEISFGEIHFEEGYEKVALYAWKDEPMHAARQLSNGKWTSKLGSCEDIEHLLAGLEGPLYGTVARLFKRSTQLQTSNSSPAHPQARPG